MKKIKKPVYTMPEIENIKELSSVFFKQADKFIKTIKNSKK